jgi:hypothetical protein
VHSLHERPGVICHQSANVQTRHVTGSSHRASVVGNKGRKRWTRLRPLSFSNQTLPKSQVWSRYIPKDANSPPSERAFLMRVRMTNLAKYRLRAVMAFARWMNVPVDVHSSFFAFGKNESRTASSSTAPK